MLPLEQLAQQLVNGVLIGLVYSLLAIGLTLIWGVMNVLNFAHGEFLMIGMFLSYWLYALAGVDPLKTAHSSRARFVFLRRSSWAASGPVNCLNAES